MVMVSIKSHTFWNSQSWLDGIYLWCTDPHVTSLVKSPKPNSKAKMVEDNKNIHLMECDPIFQEVIFMQEMPDNEATEDGM